MIGLSTYCFFWQWSDRVSEPLDLAGMLRRTRDLGVDLFQICDYPPLLGLSSRQRRELRALADDLGITLELGTKGVQPEHLESFLGLAHDLDAALVRSMVTSPDHRPTLAEAESLLRRSIPAFERAGVTLALETYEQVATADLVSLVESVGSPALGICLDPANMVAALEQPREVVERTAALVRAIHVKDFVFTRRGGWVGFTLEGAPLGAGLLDYDHLVATIRPEERGINQVIEHWLVWRDSEPETVALENEWTAGNLAYIRSKQ